MAQIVRPVAESVQFSAWQYVFWNEASVAFFWPYLWCDVSEWDVRWCVRACHLPYLELTRLVVCAVRA